MAEMKAGARTMRPGTTACCAVAMITGCLGYGLSNISMSIFAVTMAALCICWTLNDLFCEPATGRAERLGPSAQERLADIQKQARLFAVEELKMLAGWVREARHYDRDDAPDEIARAIEGRVRRLMEEASKL